MVDNLSAFLKNWSFAFKHADYMIWLLQLG